jgi:nucleotide-binding universal stress UspA family protein
VADRVCKLDTGLNPTERQRERRIEDLQPQPHANVQRARLRPPAKAQCFPVFWRYAKKECFGLGEASAEICAVAREVGASAIAMATHGRGGLARLLLGSVTTRTLQQSNVPVLIYRPVEVTRTVLERAVEKVTASAR